jgi:hypothetical protein
MIVWSWLIASSEGDTKLSCSPMDSKLFIVGDVFDILAFSYIGAFPGRLNTARIFFFFSANNIIVALITFYFQNLHHLLDLASSCDGGRAN